MASPSPPRMFVFIAFMICNNMLSKSHSDLSAMGAMLKTTGDSPIPAVLLLHVLSYESRVKHMSRAMLHPPVTLS